MAGLGWWLLVGIAAFLSGDVQGAEQRPRVRADLDGLWEFRLDPKDEGLAGKWYQPNVPFPDKIRVPGNWQAQGFGPSREHLRHDYQGKAWYRRSVEVPADWAGKRTWVHLGGTANTADVYVNGTKVGFVEGFVTPYEFDATDAIRPGAVNTIACRVDSTGSAPVGLFNFTARWGGLYRGVCLESRPDVTLDDVFVIPDVKNKIAQTQIVVGRRAAGVSWKGDLLVRIAPAGGGAAREGRAAVLLAADRREGEPVRVNVQLPDMHPWSPEDPFLYAVEVSLWKKGTGPICTQHPSGGSGKLDLSPFSTSSAGLVDRVQDRFGMRQFTVGEGGVLLLNGRPYFVRGLVDDTVEVLTGTQHPDKEIYRQRLSLVKRYGFNGIRFLGNTPIREYFEAADEVGMLIMAEGQVYHKPKPAIPLLKKQVARIAKAYRNHPSWYIFSAGNEHFECQGPTPDRDWMEYILDAHATFKRLDPSRFFVASDGADVFPTDIITQAGKFVARIDHGPVDYPFDGLIDEVACFRRALSEGQVAQLADRGIAGGADGHARLVRSLGPSGYWRLEETSPGKALDSSGQNRHGVYDPTMQQADLQQRGAFEQPPAGAAMRTDARHRGVQLCEAAKAAFAAGNDPFSVSLWVNPKGFAKGDYGTPFSYGAANDHSAFFIAEDGTEGTGKVRLGRYWNDALVSRGSLRAGEWSHVGVTYDGAELKLYLNGKLDQGVKVRLSTVPADARLGNVVQERLIVQAAEDEPYQSRPHIWHEFPNSYVMPLPDRTIARKWTGVFRDDRRVSWFDRQITELGLSERFPLVRQRSIDLFHLYLKQVYESARRSPTMDGFGYWLIADWIGANEGDACFAGIVSSLYEADKFPEPGPILEFNGPTVVLADASPDRRVLPAGESRPVEITVSHYGVQPITGGRLSWKAIDANHVLQQGTLDPVALDCGAVRPVGTIALGPFQPDTGRRVRLHVRLEAKAVVQENHWDFWVFPAGRPGLQDKPIVNRTGQKSLDRRYAIDPQRPLEQPGVVLANRLTPEVLDDLARGRTVLLLAERGALARPRPFSFWAEWIRSKGTFVEDHPAMAHFPHDGFCAYQFYRLFGRGLETLNLTEKGSPEREKLTPILWGLDQDYDPTTGLRWSHPNHRWKVYREGLLCEGRIGPGRILVCCLKVLGGLEARQPEAGHLLDCLVEYALSAPYAGQRPSITPEEARQVFKCGEP